MREERAEADPDLAARAWNIESVVQIDAAALPCGCRSCTVESLGERAGFVGRHCEAARPGPSRIPVPAAERVLGCLR